MNQLQGVIAHELGHVAGGHSIRLQRGRKAGDGHHASQTLVLGALAIAAGAGDAGMGIMMAGQQAAHRQVPRLHARPGSDRRRVRRQYLSKAGISGKGMLDFFAKLQNQEYRLAIYAKDSYDRDPPAVVGAHPGA